MSNRKVSKDIIAAFREMSPATVYEAQGAVGALASTVKPVSPQMKICGPAYTVQMRPGDNLWAHKAIYDANPGDVLVISTGGYREAGFWGEVMSTAAMTRGIQGLVTDGSVRDGRDIVEMGFPVFSAGLCMKGTAKCNPGTLNVPLNFEGVTIQPGDLILGDMDGVVVIPAAKAEEVLHKARVRKEKEDAFIKRLEQGESTWELYGFDRIFTKMGYQ